MSRRIRAVVEARVRRFSSKVDSQILRKLSNEFLVDETFPPIAIKPPTTSLEMSFAAAQEQLVLIRGTIDENRVDILRSLPNVVDAYIDSELAPFNRRSRPRDRETSCMHSPAESPTDCPIPPCDCECRQPRGCLNDVGIYLGADSIWAEGIDGSGVVVGIVDAGICACDRASPQLPTLAQRVSGGFPDANWGTMAGWRGHGNMLGNTVLGIAPKATLYDIRICDVSQDGARISDAIAGIHWALEKYRTTGKPQILCCGWGIYQRAHDPRYAAEAKHPLTRKIVEAIDDGLIVLFAAGNGGQCCPMTACGRDVGPGRSIWGANGHPRVMSIGAVNIEEQLIGYSSQGPAALDEYKPDFCGISHFQGYFPSDSGTSTACAVAAGVVALLKQVRPTLTQEAAKHLLKATAKDIGPPGWDRHTGAGIIRAKAAYDALIGSRPSSHAVSERMERLEAENRCLKELFVELALDRRMGRASNSTAD